MKKLFTPFFLVLLLSNTNIFASDFPGNSLYQIKAELTDQDNKKNSLDVYAGHPVLIALFYSSCTYTCPILINSLQKLENSLTASAKKETRFLLVSFDPKRDTPDKLKKLAVEHKIDLSRWKFVSSKEASIQEIAAALDVKYRQTADGEFNHSTAITLLDQSGAIVSADENISQVNPSMLKKIVSLLK